jgi:hypothetical protein
MPWDIVLVASANSVQYKDCCLLVCDAMVYTRGADKSLALPGGKKATVTVILSFIYPIYNHNWRNISTVYITRLASKEIFSPSNKIHREVGRAKDLSAIL